MLREKQDRPHHAASYSKYLGIMTADLGVNKTTFCFLGKSSAYRFFLECVSQNTAPLRYGNVSYVSIYNELAGLSMPRRDLDMNAGAFLHWACSCKATGA